MINKNIKKEKIKVDNCEYNNLTFFNDYEDIVKASENWVILLKKFYKNVSIEDHGIDYENKRDLDITQKDLAAEELFVRLIRCESLISPGERKEERENETKRKKLILQTGVHGIEGYVGAILVDYFIRKDLKKLIYDDNLDFDLFIILNSNPYGVSYKRRVNENNVDLNRNFLLSERDFDAFELDKQELSYKAIDRIVNLDTEKSLKFQSLFLDSILIVLKILRYVIKNGSTNFKNNLLSGQSFNKKGLYYRGSEYQPETKIIKDIFQNIINNNCVLIDLHSGYGPRYQMSIVNSSFEPQSIEQMKADFEYPLVVKSSSNEFYNISGDMIDYLYKTFYENSRLKYATTFEFGTFGDSLIASLKSVIAVALENQNFFNRKNSKSFDKKIRKLFKQAYYPVEKKWWNKAVADFEKAIFSICNFHLKY